MAVSVGVCAPARGGGAKGAEEVPRENGSAGDGAPNEAGEDDGTKTDGAVKGSVSEASEKGSEA